jgi:hypothetical protein
MKPIGTGRKIAIWALIVLATLITFISTFTIWGKRQLLSTDHWTKSSAALLQNPDIRAAVSANLVDALYQNTDVQAQFENALPPKLKPLAPQVTSAVQSASERVVYRLLGTARVQKLWVEANRRAHQRLVAVLEEKKSGNISSQNGVVTLDLRGMLLDIAHSVGLSGRLVQKIPADSAQITIANSKQLAAAQNAVSIIKALSSLLVIAVFFLYGLAIFLARGRRRTFVEVSGFSLITVGLIVLVLRRVIENLLLDSLVKTDSYRPAVKAVWLIETSVLRDIGIALISYGVLAVVGGFLAGPSRIAVRIRSWLAPAFRDHVAGTYAAVVTIMLILLAWAPLNSGRRLWGTLILAALILFGVEVLRRQTVREFPGDSTELPQSGPPPPAAPAGGST